MFTMLQSDGILTATKLNIRTSVRRVAHRQATFTRVNVVQTSEPERRQ